MIGNNKRKVSLKLDDLLAKTSTDKSSGDKPTVTRTNTKHGTQISVQYGNKDRKPSAKIAHSRELEKHKVAPPNLRKTVRQSHSFSLRPPSAKIGGTNSVNTTGRANANTKKSAHWIIKLFATIIVVAILIAIPVGLIKLSNKATKLLSAFNISLTAKDVTALVTAEPKLKTDANGNTNIMLIGIDSRGKIGQGLMNTDTIILFSYNTKKHEVFGVSFPRDLWVKYPGTYYSNKINAVYAYGQRQHAGHGLEYLKGLIERLSGLRVQYYAMINFDGFRQLIDKLGGIDVYVERSFVDYSYPKGLGYQTVRFTKGWNHFNGERALQYARSRKAHGPEGSDFARAKRQQKVIQAVINRVKKQGITDPKTIYGLLNVVADNIIISKITPLDIQAGLKLLQKGEPKMHSLVLEPTSGNYTLITRGAGHLYTLIPRAGQDNWSQVQRYIKDWFSCADIINSNSTIHVYNAGDVKFTTHFRGIQHRYFYMKIINGGKLSKYIGKVSTSPNKKFINGAKCITKSIKYVKYQDYNPDSMPSKIKDNSVAIILGADK